MNHPDPRIVHRALSQGLFDLVLVTHQKEFADLPVALQRLFDALDHDPASVVATHDIHNDSHKAKERGGPFFHPRSSDF